MLLCAATPIITPITRTSPGLRTGGYPPGYYAAFVLDPDRNNIEAVFREQVMAFEVSGGCEGTVLKCPAVQRCAAGYGTAREMA